MLQVGDFFMLWQKIMLNPNLGVGGNFTRLPLPPPFWFSLNNLETVKRCKPGIWQHFIRDIRAKFGIPNSHQSSNIGQN